MKRRFRRRRGEPEELNITAFMNLMVGLVPFLLITAVFSRITVLELNLPVAADAAESQDQQPLQLEVIVREDRIEVAYHGGARMATVARGESGFDFAKVSTLLQQLKSNFPEAESVTILMEPDVPYELLVQVMDVVRVYRIEDAQGGRVAELFPQIAIGDAPPARANSPDRANP